MLKYCVIHNLGMDNGQNISSINPQVLAQNSAAALANARRTDISSERREAAMSPATAKDLNNLVRLLASKMQIPENIAYKLIRNLMASGKSFSTDDIKTVLGNYVANSATKQGKTLDLALASLRAAETQSKTDQELERIFRPVVKEIKDQFVSSRDKGVRDAAEQLSSRKTATEKNINSEMMLTKLALSPKEFASWLVNNRSAFVMLKTNPELTYMLMSLNNPRIQQSPVLLAELLKLMTQVLKLKQGKTSTDTDEALKDIRDKEAARVIADHEANIVNNLANTTTAVAVNPLRDFLLEAERFAEEEIANFWSLALKKEKILEKKLQKNLLKLRNAKSSRSRPSKK